MRSKKTPLKWLEAFEAAGRTGSFKTAAEELSVSASNVSHQIRSLENYLGTPLFSRLGGRIVLTQEGAALLPQLTLGFQNIRQAQTGSQEDLGVFRIGAFPFVANELIAPEIEALTKLLPYDEVRLFTSNDLHLLTHINPNERLDVVIRYANPGAKFPGLNVRELGAVSLVPVVGPGVRDVVSPEQLVELPLAQVLGPFDGWARWWAEHLPGASQPDFVLKTDSYHSAMLAVARGEVACLAVLPFIGPWLQDGRIRALTDLKIPLPEQQAVLVSAPYQEGNAAIPAFAEWLSNQWTQ